MLGRFRITQLKAVRLAYAIRGPGNAFVRRSPLPQLPYSRDSSAGCRAFSAGRKEAIGDRFIPASSAANPSGGFPIQSAAAAFGLGVFAFAADRYFTDDPPKQSLDTQLGLSSGRADPASREWPRKEPAPNTLKASGEVDLHGTGELEGQDQLQPVDHEEREEDAVSGSTNSAHSFAAGKGEGPPEIREVVEGIVDQILTEQPQEEGPERNSVEEVDEVVSVEIIVEATDSADSGELAASSDEGPEVVLQVVEISEVEEPLEQESLGLAEGGASSVRQGDEKDGIGLDGIVHETLGAGADDESTRDRVVSPDSPGAASEAVPASEAVTEVEDETYGFVVVGEPIPGSIPEEELKDEDCGFCVFMKRGPCGQTFKRWEDCAEGVQETGEDVVKTCLPFTVALRDCMSKNSTYYAVVLEMEDELGQEDAKVAVEEKVEDGSHNPSTEPSAAEAAAIPSPPGTVQETGVEAVHVTAEVSSEPSQTGAADS